MSSSEVIFNLDESTKESIENLSVMIDGVAQYLPMWIRYEFGEQADKYSKFVRQNWLSGSGPIGKVTGETQKYLGAYSRKIRIKRAFPIREHSTGRPREYDKTNAVVVRPGAADPQGARHGTFMNFHGIWSTPGEHQIKAQKGASKNSSAYKTTKSGGRYKTEYIGSYFTRTVPSGYEFMKPSFASYTAGKKVENAVISNIESGINWLIDKENLRG